MYFNGYFARDYYTDDYWGVSGAPDQGFDFGQYKGLYLGLYTPIYQGGY